MSEFPAIPPAEAEERYDATPDQQPIAA